jgi:hypothetical protein
LVTVTQQGPAAVLSIAPLIQNVTYQAGVTTFAVSSNTSWTAVSDASWCQPTPSGTGSSTLSATYQQNTTMVVRTANITVSAANVSPVILQVIQQPSFVETNEFKKYEFDVFPNPASETITVLLPEVESGASLILYNAEGRKVIEQKISNSSFQLDIKALKKGNYLLKIMNGDYTANKKIVII